LKKILVFLSLIFLILPFYISYAFLLYDKYQVKSELKQRLLNGIDRKDLVLFMLSLSDYQALISSDQELHYAGDEYDLVDAEKIGERYHCWFWLDSEESELNHKLSLLVSEAMGEDCENEEGGNLLHDFFELLYCYDHHTLSSSPHQLIESKKSFYSMEYYFFYYTFLIDPPENRLV